MKTRTLTISALPLLLLGAIPARAEADKDAIIKFFGSEEKMLAAAEKDLFAEALMTANKMVMLEVRDDLLAEIAGDMAAAGRIEDSIKLAAILSAPHTQIRALVKIVTTLIHRGELKQSQSILDKATNLLELEIQRASPGHQQNTDQPLSEIALLQARSGNIAGAVKLGRKIFFEPKRAAILSEIAAIKGNLHR